MASCTGPKLDMPCSTPAANGDPQFHSSAVTNCSRSRHAAVTFAAQSPSRSCPPPLVFENVAGRSSSGVVRSRDLLAGARSREKGAGKDLEPRCFLALLLPAPAARLSAL